MLRRRGRQPHRDWIAAQATGRSFEVLDPSHPSGVSRPGERQERPRGQRRAPEKFVLHRGGIAPTPRMAVMEPGSSSDYFGLPAGGMIQVGCRIVLWHFGQSAPDRSAPSMHTSVSGR